MMNFDDQHSAKVFGLRLSAIRGMALLVNVVSMIDANAWPLEERCFDIKKHRGNIRETARREMLGLSDVLVSYFSILNATESVDEDVIGDIQKWTAHEHAVEDIDGLDVSNLMTKWLDEDKALFANIRSWQLYHRDVPRQLFWERMRTFRAHDDPWEI